MTLPSDIEKKYSVFLELTQDEAAARFLLTVSAMIRLADNIADRHSVNPQRDMATLLRMALVDIPTDPFFVRHQFLLSNAFGAAISMWDVSNLFHGSKDQTKQTFGFVHREAGEQFTLQVIAICRGWAFARESYVRIFEMIHTENETVEDWVKEA